MKAHGMLSSWGVLSVAALAALAAPMAGCKTIAKGININGQNMGEAFQSADDFTPENEYYVGRSVGTSILAKYDYKYADKEAIQSGRLEGTTEYVNRVGNLVAVAALEVTRKGDRPAPISGWHFVILENDQINAFAAPGGYVFVTSGALKKAKNEDELAAILSHEVAHVVRGHALGTIAKSRMAGVGTKMLTESVKVEGAGLERLKKAFDGAMNDMMDALLVKGYSKETEFEADRVGMEIMARAGYDTGAFVRYLETLAKTQATGSGGFYATHPKSTDRIAKLKVQMGKMASKKAPKSRTDRFVSGTAAIRQ